jgi:CRP-like cAMP-binding protein
MSPHLAPLRMPVARIRRLRFFQSFAPAEVARLARLATLTRLGDGELLATEGTCKQRRILYVVITGELHYVKRIRGDLSRPLLRLAPGDIGGFLTFFSEDPSPVSVRSGGNTTVLEIGRREFQLLTAEDPALAGKLLAALARALSERLGSLLGGMAATSVWALDLERHLQDLPLGEPRGEA